MGYASALQPFQVEVISSELVVTAAGAGEPQEFRSFRLRRGGMGTATAALTSVGRAFPNDLPAEGLKGKIALIERGEITFEEKVTRVGDAGALAAVVYNNVAGLFGGTLMDESPIPAVAISREDGEAILKLMGQGEVEATVSVTFETRDSQNVIADKPGSGGDGAVVVLGGHYDTVENVPGANDNGIGNRHAGHHRPGDLG